MIDKSNFYEPNGYRTQSLFYETCPIHDRGPWTQYTLKNWDHTVGEHESAGRTIPAKTYISLRKRYIEMMDITEYEFANTYLLDFDHWKALAKAGWFQEYLVLWRDELEAKMKAMALKGIIGKAVSEEKDALSAQKYLFDSVWLPKDKQAPGRPTQKRIKEEAAKLVKDDGRIEEDMRRLGLIQ